MQWRSCQPPYHSDTGMNSLPPPKGQKSKKTYIRAIYHIHVMSLTIIHVNYHVKQSLTIYNTLSNEQQFVIGYLKLE